MTSNFKIGAKNYRNGMKAAKSDVNYGGKEFAQKELAYGLNGCSSTYCKGYRDYLSKYAK